MIGSNQGMHLYIVQIYIAYFLFRLFLLRYGGANKKRKSALLIVPSYRKDTSMYDSEI